MSHNLAELLGTDHPLFVYNLSLLEKAAGDKAVDAKLYADCLENAHKVMRELSLDPADTKAAELYHTLSSLVKDEGKLVRLLRDKDYVLLAFPEGPVSFNIQDVVENAHHELPFEKRVGGHGQRHLRQEIIKRYSSLERTDPDLVKKLASEAGLVQPNDEYHQELTLPGATQNEPDQRKDASLILTIGDIFTDAFIKLGDDAAKIITDSEGKQWLSLPFGQKPPYEQVDIVRSVGPSPNAAVSMSRLGLKTQLMAWVGGDVTGEEAISHLRTEHVNTDLMVTEKDKLTSYWYVLRYDADRTMLVKSESYSYQWQLPKEDPEWVYLSYIGPDSWPLHEALLNYLEPRPDIKLVFQPGTFHFKWGTEKLKAIYKRSHIVIMNREEAADVTGKPTISVQNLAKALHELGPEKVVITDGSKGSYASYDNRLITIPNYPDVAPPVDRTGAGDAFASTIIAALAQGETMDTAMTWAPINSMSVVQKVGAQAGLLSREELEKYLSKAPENYKIMPYEG